MGELDNTFVFYTADHGMAIGRHGLQGKQNLYQHTWRVPFIVKGPGIKAGSRVEGNIYLLDVLATLCDLAGVPAPATNEGLTFKSVLTGEKSQIRDVLYGAYCGGTKPGMYYPTKDEFLKLAAEGNLIPVTRSILADFETPLSAYRKIRGQGESFLFESVEGGEHIGRYSFVGCNPRAVIVQNGNRALSLTSFMTKKVRVCRTPGSAISFWPCNLLKSAMSRTRIFRR